MEAKVLSEQSLFDVVLQLTGSIESVLEVACFNNISITDDLPAGDKLLIPPSVKTDEDILNYYRAKKIQPATAITEELQTEEPEGIGYWAIGVDFVVS